jgi:hypothetical protein
MAAIKRTAMMPPSVASKAKEKLTDPRASRYTPPAKSSAVQTVGGRGVTCASVRAIARKPATTVSKNSTKSASVKRPEPAGPRYSPASLPV